MHVVPMEIAWKDFHHTKYSKIASQGFRNKATK